MTYKFINQDNERYRAIIESEFLEGPNPFPRNPVCTRDNLPKFCLGRDEEIGIINLTAQTIKSQDNTENKSNKAMYWFAAFCVLLGVLFIIKKKKYKNEFR